MSKPKKGPIDTIEVYRLAALLFTATSVMAFIVLYIFVLIDKSQYYAAEATDTLLGLVLLVFALLFAISYVFSIRRVRINADKKQEVKG